MALFKKTLMEGIEALTEDGIHLKQVAKSASEIASEGPGFVATTKYTTDWNKTKFKSGAKAISIGGAIGGGLIGLSNNDEHPVLGAATGAIVGDGLATAAQIAYHML